MDSYSLSTGNESTTALPARYGGHHKSGDRHTFSNTQLLPYDFCRCTECLQLKARLAAKKKAAAAADAKKKGIAAAAAAEAKARAKKSGGAKDKSKYNQAPTR